MVSCPIRQNLNIWIAFMKNFILKHNADLKFYVDYEFSNEHSVSLNDI